MEVVNFALAYRRVRVFRIPPLSRNEIADRNLKIRSEFATRREVGEAAAAIIEDLADRFYLSTKQIEATVYPRK